MIMSADVVVANNIHCSYVVLVRHLQCLGAWTLRGSFRMHVFFPARMMQAGCLGRHRATIGVSEVQKPA